ncbi:hypothetical protein FGO68_gene17039 [Halteria grandinella]|uniref:Uncharacterized protein n=1 Tax=Halteria grandinella TaxID=5974 RepID=A0A8J8N8S1_HALGN|nr:hypothetical protein FGO68_gene17039 [Halteria grandinella]
MRKKRQTQNIQDLSTKTDGTSTEYQQNPLGTGVTSLSLQDIDQSDTQLFRTGNTKVILEIKIEGRRVDGCERRAATSTLRTADV